MDNTAFTGKGLDSIKLACINGKYFRQILRALSQSLLSAARVIADISAGISFDATEITPTPPKAITGNVTASSPESTQKLSGTSPQISAIWLTLPLASFTPIILGISVKRTSVAGSR